MKKLEDQLKETFNHFEPEVNPSVWDKISSNLNGPVVYDGGSAISSGITKGILAKLGPLAGWVGGAAVLISAGVIIWKLNTQSTTNPEDRTHKVEVQNPLPKTEIPIESNDQPASSIPDNKQDNRAPAVLKEEHSTVFQNGSGHSSVDHSVSETTNTGDNNSSLNTETKPLSDNPTNTSTRNNENQADVKEINTANSNSSNQDQSNQAISGNSAEKTSVMSSATLPEPALIVNTRGGFAPLSVTVLTNQNGQLADFDFGDGSLSNGTATATHQYEEPGTYKITCKIGNREVETSIDIIGRISTAFSPNADGINDLFTAGSDRLQSVEMRIYDRTGKQLFSAKGQVVSWDGKIAGNRPAETGTYFYDIFATSENGVTYKQKGTIHLFR